MNIVTAVGDKITNISTNFDGNLVLNSSYNGNEIKEIASCACYCGSIRGIDLRKTSIVSINAKAFFNCFNLTFVYFSETLESIGGNSFVNSNINVLNITKKLVNFDGFSFNQSPNINDIIVDQGNQAFYSEGRCLFRKEDHTLILAARNISSTDEIPKFNEIKKIGSCAFTMSLLKNFVGSPCLESLCSYAFHVMKKVSLIDLSSTKIEMIPDRAFRYCLARRILLPHNITSIDTSSFGFASRLTSLMFHCPLKSINGLPFEGCTQLRSLYYFGSTDFSNVEAFSQNSITKIYVTNDYKGSKFCGKRVIYDWDQHTCNYRKNHDSISTKCFIFIIISL